MRDNAAHVADVARAHAHVVGHPRVRPRRGETVHHIHIVGVAQHAANVHPLARHGAHGNLVAVVDLGEVRVLAGVVRVGIEIGIVHAIGVVLLRGQNATVLNDRVPRRSHHGAQVQALAA